MPPFQLRTESTAMNPTAALPLLPHLSFAKRIRRRRNEVKRKQHFLRQGKKAQGFLLCFPLGTAPLRWLNSTGSEQAAALFLFAAVTKKEKIALLLSSSFPFLLRTTGKKAAAKQRFAFQEPRRVALQESAQRSAAL